MAVCAMLSLRIAPSICRVQRSSGSAMSRLQWALLAGGAILLVVLVVEVGPGAVLASFATLSWWLPIIIAFPFCLVTAFDTLGWKFAFRRDGVSFLALLTARMAGEAFNATTPTASVGGEA